MIQRDYTGHLNGINNQSEQLEQSVHPQIQTTPIESFHKNNNYEVSPSKIATHPSNQSI